VQNSTTAADPTKIVLIIIIYGVLELDEKKYLQLPTSHNGKNFVKVFRDKDCNIDQHQNQMVCFVSRHTYMLSSAAFCCRSTTGF